MLTLFRTIANKLSRARTGARGRFRVTFTIYHDTKPVSNFEMIVTAWDKDHARRIVNSLVDVKATKFEPCR